jgi:hypothetical protein
MIETDVLADIHCEIQPDILRAKLHLRAGSQDDRDLMRMIDEANKIANPKVLYGASMIEKRGREKVVLSGVEFTSRVLSVNLEKAEQVFPFVATCGKELYDWGRTIDDMVWGYWADMIQEEALVIALNAIHIRIPEVYHLAHTSTMSPGSLENWPIHEQRPLFGLLGNPENEIGVTLTDSYLMIPAKSVSGIIFPTEGNFESCMLCQRENCPNRRTPYDETLFEREYCLAGGK